MDPESSPRAICEEIASEVRQMAVWLSAGQLDAAQFRGALLALEAAKVHRFGFTLSGESRPGGRSHFELRFLKDGSLCATMDFDSGSSELSVNHLCG